MKHASSIIKCIWKIDTFSNIGAHEVSYVLSDLNTATFSGTTHIKTIFNFSPGTDEHFNGNTLCNSNDSPTQLIHIFHLLAMSSTNSQKENPYEKQNYLFCLPWRTYDKWWHLTGYDGKHCFASCPCGDSFPVRRCITSLLPSCLCLSGQGISWSLGRKRHIPWPTRSPCLNPFDFLFWRFAKDTVCREKVQNVNELRDNH
jgi:hypothetical protein